MDGRWKQIVYVLCAFGFLKDMRPSDSFLTEFLVGPHKNLTLEQVYQDVYPIGTYASLVFAVIIFLVTDYLQYRPIVILEAAAGTATYAILVWGADIQQIQVSQIFYGLFMACDVAYSSYLFAAMPRSDNSVGEGQRYRRAASLVNMASLSGRVGAAAAGQFVFILCKDSNKDLFIFSMTAIACSFAVALLLPPILKHKPYSSYDAVNQETDGHNLDTLVEGHAVAETAVDVQTPSKLTPRSPQPSRKFPCVLSDLITSFSSPTVVVWSLWFTLITCGITQVSTYVQTLWRLATEDDDKTVYNGGVNALTTLLGVAATWSVGKIKSGGAIMWLAPTCSTFAGVFLLLAARTTSLYTQYVAYGGFKVFGYMISTLASAEVARSVARVADCQGLVFGVNAAIALGIQSLITMAVTGKGGFQHDVRAQFHIYGGYFILMGAIYGMAVAVVKSVRSWPSPEDRLPVSKYRSKSTVQNPTKTHS